MTQNKNSPLLVSHGKNIKIGHLSPLVFISWASIFTQVPSHQCHTLFVLYKIDKPIPPISTAVSHWKYLLLLSIKAAAKKNIVHYTGASQSTSSSTSSSSSWNALACIVTCIQHKSSNKTSHQRYLSSVFTNICNFLKCHHILLYFSISLEIQSGYIVHFIYIR